jgi:hypothetical protein
MQCKTSINPKPYKILKHLVLGSSLITILGCGGNLFQGSEASDPAEDAALLLEKDKPSDAIKLLEKALVKSPGAPKLLSMLSAAYAQRAGIEPLAMARNLASPGETTSSSSGGSDQSNNSLVSLFGVTPKATEDSVYDISYAVTILTVDLNQDQWLPGDQFKLAIFQTSASVMRLKILDKDNDGKLSLSEIASLTSASSIISQLAASQASLGRDPNDTSSVKAAESLAKYQAAIAASEGANDDEKLKNYLAKSSTQTQ